MFTNIISATIVKNAPITNARLFNFLYIADDLEEYDVQNDSDRKQDYCQWHDPHVPFVGCVLWFLG